MIDRPAPSLAQLRITVKKIIAENPTIFTTSNPVGWIMSAVNKLLPTSPIYLRPMIVAEYYQDNAIRHTFESIQTELGNLRMHLSEEQQKKLDEAENDIERLIFKFNVPDKKEIAGEVSSNEFTPLN